MLDFDTTNLLRPNQVADAQEELKRLSDTLNAPPHIRSRISDLREMRVRRDRLKTELDKYTPRAYGPDEKDSAIRELEALQEKIRIGMPSSEEMRRNPPGAVSKQLAWEKQNTTNVLRLKHLALRLGAGGDVPDSLKHQGDLSNIERLRPLTTPTQLAMDGAQIPKVRDIHIGSDPANAVTFNDEELLLLAQTAPDLAGQLALLPIEARAGIKEILKAALVKPAEPTPPPAPVKGKVLSEYNRMKKAAAKARIVTFRMTKDEMKATLAERGIEY